MKKCIRRLGQQVVLFSAFGFGHAVAQTVPPTPPAGMQASSSHDFDFFFGSWRVQNKRLLKPLQGSTQWESFEGIQICAPLLGGAANYDELRTLSQEPIGMSIHLFDQAKRTWSSTWVSARDGQMQPPVSGTFVNGVGILEGRDQHEGKPVRVRYTWSRTDTSTPRWEQAFSADEGKTWETNWVMDYSPLKPK